MSLLYHDEHTHQTSFGWALGGSTPSQIITSYGYHVLRLTGKGKKRTRVKIPEPLTDLIDEYNKTSVCLGAYPSKSPILYKPALPSRIAP